MVMDIALFFSHWWPLLLSGFLFAAGLALCFFFACRPYILAFGVVLFLAFYARPGRLAVERTDAADCRGGTVVAKNKSATVWTLSRKLVLERSKSPTLTVKGCCRHGKTIERVFVVNEQEFGSVDIGDFYGEKKED